MLRHVFAIIFTVTAECHEVLLFSFQTLHIILLEEFHLVLTVEIVSQLWHRKICEPTFWVGGQRQQHEQGEMLQKACQQEHRW